MIIRATRWSFGTPMLINTAQITYCAEHMEGHHSLARTVVYFSSGSYVEIKETIDELELLITRANTKTEYSSELPERAMEL